MQFFLTSIESEPESKLKARFPLSDKGWTGNFFTGLSVMIKPNASPSTLVFTACQKLIGGDFTLLEQHHRCGLSVCNTQTFHLSPEECPPFACKDTFLMSNKRPDQTAFTFYYFINNIDQSILCVCIPEAKSQYCSHLLYITA